MLKDYFNYKLYRKDQVKFNSQNIVTNLSINYI